jgi:hypothetical protein
MLGPGSIRSPKRKPETKSYIGPFGKLKKKKKYKEYNSRQEKQGEKIGTSQVGYPKEQAFQQIGSGKKKREENSHKYKKERGKSR